MSSRLTEFLEVWMQRVSVAVTVLNEIRDMPELLRSLTTQTLPASEIVVVDGGSTDGTWEYLQMATDQFPALKAIRDPSCSLRFSPGPIARGRNVGIAAAGTAVVATADAGCRYQPEWLERLTAPLREGAAEYVLGGSCLDPEGATVWDYASAPFFGVKLRADGRTKSCTARSMAFTKQLWERAGRFPETVFLGEDSLFDRVARSLVTPVFATEAKAMYRPGHGFGSAVRQMASYAAADGMLGIRPARLLRNLLRCVAEVVALAALRWTWVPVVAVGLLEAFFAFRMDWRDLPKQIRVVEARAVFSLAVPWVVSWHMIRGAARHRAEPNRQNMV